MKKGILGLVTTIMGAAAGAATMNYLKGKKLSEKAEKVDKFKGYYNLLNQWLVNKHEGKSLDRYLLEQGYKSIAIYGMGELGNRLYEELKNSEVEVKYAVDKKAESTYSELNVVGLDDELEQVDAIVVTATYAYDEICEELEGIMECPIISLESVIFDL